MTPAQTATTTALLLHSPFAAMEGDPGAGAPVATATGDHSVMTCNSCRLRLHGVEARNVHYKSEHHRVNVKRKTAGMGPLSEAEFSQRLEQVRAEKEEDARSRQSAYCTTCSKRFSSSKALENHERSRRHLDACKGKAMSEVSEAVADEEMLMERRLKEAKPITVTTCVFDGTVFNDVEENLAYMASMFGFFLPYIDRLIDLHGLLTYIGLKVGVGYACVHCDKAFATVDAVRRHMISKQHCRMTADDDVWVEEYASYYEFSAENDQGDDNNDDQGWEEVDEVTHMIEEQHEKLSVVNEQAAIAALRVIQPLASAASVSEVHGAEDVSLAVNGKVLGHRSLARYYQQSYAQGAIARRPHVDRVIREYRQLGWKGHQAPKAVLKAARKQAARNRKFELQVGHSNYYTRKSAIKPSMAVFNSGYRP